MPLRTLSIPDLKIDTISLNLAEDILQHEGVKDAVLFPDSYTKEKYLNLEYKITIPSSSAIVSQNDILYPQFRSRGINCGMMAVALPMSETDLFDQLVKDISASITYDPLYYALYRLRIPWYSRKFDLSYNEFIRTLEGEEVKVAEVSHLLSKDWLQKRTVRMRQAFGTYFGGNHFLEIQTAENDAPSLGIQRGQVVIMYHTGCQGMQEMIREDLAQKYFYSSTFTPAYRGEEMYEAFFVAQGMLERYTTAYRNATKQIIDAALRQHGFSESLTIINEGHNGVKSEVINEESVLVYRHNAAKLYKGDIAIISGMYDHPSYIIEGGENVEQYINSVDHGLGMVLKRGRSKNISTQHTVNLLRYTYGLRILQKKGATAIIKNPYTDQYFELLEQHKIGHRLVSLRPLFNMKHTK